MLHTLLPTYERAKLRREYRIRAAIVLCFMLSVAGVIGIISVLPSYVKVSLAERAAATDLAALKQKNVSTNLSRIQADIAETRAMLAALGSAKDQKVSVLIGDLVSLRGPIRLSSLSFGKSDASTVTIGIQGLAPTREALLSFKDRLEAALPGNRVDFPVSLLAKSTDISFSLTLTSHIQ